MTAEQQNPFSRGESVDDPGIIGAVWWNQSLRETSSPATRRSLLLAIGAVVGLYVVMPLAIVRSASAFGTAPRAPDYREASLPSLQAQRDYGWNFGAATEKVVFDGASLQPFDRASLRRLVGDLSPSQPNHRAHCLMTLFESPEATPRATLPEPERWRHVPLAEVLKPIRTPRMDFAYAAGERIVPELVKVPGTAILVDLAGHESVAFAAGGALHADPVMLFDNWPHPRGVVPAHHTLAAAAYYQPRFAAARRERKPAAPPMFILDGHRMASYADAADRFDNRFLARLPDRAAMERLGVKRLHYISSFGEVREADDLNHYFVAYHKSGIEILRLAMPVVSSRIPTAAESTAYRPEPRPTEYAGGAAKPGVKFAQVTVITDKAGRVLGAKMNRNGSWNRASSSSGGG